MSQFDITCPEDYQKYFHVNEQGHVWLDGRNNPIPFTHKLTRRINSIPPQTLWLGRHTRSGVHSKDNPPLKDDPHNSTGKTQAPPSIAIPTSPIPKDQEIHREVIQGVLDDPKIPKSWLGTAWEETKNLFSPNKIDNLQSGHQMSQPTANISDSHHLGTAQSTGSSDSTHLGAEQSTNSSHSQHKSTASDSNQNSNPQPN